MSSKDVIELSPVVGNDVNVQFLSILGILCQVADGLSMRLFVVINPV